MPTLFYSRNPNPRLAVAVARHLGAPVTLEWAAPFAPDQAARFLKLNPTRRIPILVEDGAPLWEADAIACRLSQMVGSDFWRQGVDQPDMIRWISWGKDTFVRACDMVQFELGTKRRYHRHLRPDEARIAEGTAMFHEAAAILNDHLERRDWLTGSTPSHADFRMASFLPFNDIMCLPLARYPALLAWNERLLQIPAWADPFTGLDAPELRPASARPPAPTAKCRRVPIVFSLPSARGAWCSTSPQKPARRPPSSTCRSGPSGRW